MMPRITATRIDRVIKTVKYYFRFNIDTENAIKIIKWDEDESFVKELSANGRLDTLAREYFTMAVIDVLMPGPPTIQDSFVRSERDRWHWPCYGSSDDYLKAFTKAWRKAVRPFRMVK